MEFEVQTQIGAPRERLSRVISDIEHSASVISAITRIDVLEKGTDGLLGFKWRETRTIFGKQAVETMWITEVLDGVLHHPRRKPRFSLRQPTLTRGGERSHHSHDVIHRGATDASRQLYERLAHAFLQGRDD